MSRGGHAGYASYRRRTFVSRAWVVFASAAGALLTIMSAYTEFLGAFAHPRAVLVAVALCAVTGAVVAGAQAMWQLSDVSVEVHPGFEVRVVVGDFMDNIEKFRDAACVFGVNDTFDTSLLMSASIHAQFLDRYFPEQDPAARQAQMDTALANSGLHLGGSKPTDNVNQRAHFEHGTVACFEFSKRTDGAPRHAFLLANSRRERHGYSGNKLTAGSIRRIWDYLEDSRLGMEQIVFALVGTGNSGDLSPMASLFHVLEEYFREIEKRGFSGARVKSLVLSVRPQVVQDGSIDLAVVHAYLKARTRFSSALA